MKVTIAFAIVSLAATSAFAGPAGNIWQVPKETKCIVSGNVITCR